MIIHTSGNKKIVKIEKIPYGECFKLDNKYYMRGKFITDDMIVTIDLSNGLVSTVMGNTGVCPVLIEARVTVEG